MVRHSTIFLFHLVVASAAVSSVAKMSALRKEAASSRKVRQKQRTLMIVEDPDQEVNGPIPRGPDMVTIQLTTNDPGHSDGDHSDGDMEDLVITNNTDESDAQEEEEDEDEEEGGDEEMKGNKKGKEPKERKEPKEKKTEESDGELEDESDSEEEDEEEGEEEGGEGKMKGKEPKEKKVPKVKKQKTPKGKKANETDPSMSILDLLTESDEYEILLGLIEIAQIDTSLFSKPAEGGLEGVALFAPEDQVLCEYCQELLYQGSCDEKDNILAYLGQVFDLARMTKDPPTPSLENFIETFLLNHLTTESVDLQDEVTFLTAAEMSYTVKKMGGRRNRNIMKVHKSEGPDVGMIPSYNTRNVILTLNGQVGIPNWPLVP